MKLRFLIDFWNERCLFEKFLFICRGTIRQPHPYLYKGSLLFKWLKFVQTFPQLNTNVHKINIVGSRNIPIQGKKRRLQSLGSTTFFFYKFSLFSRFFLSLTSHIIQQVVFCVVPFTCNELLFMPPFSFRFRFFAFVDTDKERTENTRQPSKNSLMDSEEEPWSLLNGSLD